MSRFTVTGGRKEKEVDKMKKMSRCKRDEEIEDTNKNKKPMKDCPSNVQGYCDMGYLECPFASEEEFAFEESGEILETCYWCDVEFDDDNYPHEYNGMYLCPDCLKEAEAEDEGLGDPDGDRDYQFDKQMMMED
jgi:hypothetical protein